MRNHHIGLLAVMLGVAATSGCGSNDPSRVGRPPVVESYQPSGRRLSAFVGDTLRFSLSAVDPDRDPLATTFTVDGTSLGSSIPWFYAVEDTGCVTVRGSVTDGDYTSFIDWTVERHRPVNYPPEISVYQPIELSPTIIIGNSLGFAVVASDPDGDELSYNYSVNDSLVASTRQFSYRATSVGYKLVRATVSDGEHYASQEWNLRVTAVPDTIAPAKVVITGVGPGFNPGEIQLAWIAVGKDGMIGKPSQYQVRTAPNPILSEDDWSRASQRPGVPAPAVAGATMNMVAGGLLPARTTYVTVRALDDFGNVSPLGDSPSVITKGMRISGSVVDAITGSPVAGATVQIGLFRAPSATDGSWQMDELPNIDDVISASDESVADIGQYFDVKFPYNVVNDAVTPFYLIPNRTLDTGLYSDFLQFFRSMTDIAGNPYGTQQRRWRLPIDLYVRPYERDGLDYKAAIEGVAAEFDAILGTQVFRIVSVRNGIGVETAYRDDIPQDKYGVTEWTSDWYPHIGLIQFRTVYTPATQQILERTARHEFGHALGLNHSSDINHIMVGGVAPQVNAFSADEIAVLQTLYRVPRGFDNRRYDRN
ncbi:MAG TPA: matrixin family metalloprotease [Candidatus Krumholzibacteria bacterium]|nr:matrixin family metalloprotease [Candidatus Krumholzibacteria bacterium]